MSARARHSAFYDDDDFLRGERIGPPPRRSRGIVRALVLLFIAGGGGWLLLTDQAQWPSWVRDVTAGAWSALKGAMPTRVERAAQAPASPAPRIKPEPPRIASDPPLAPQPTALAKAAVLPTPPTAQPESSPLTTGSLPAAASRDEDAPGVPLRVKADPADPYQVRAEAVGLHPGLSRVLLERLSDEDYRNAGVAIKTAVAETADGASYVWPRQRKPQLALFKVHFVAGAAPGCRRYVVTITKDRWATTARPMEKCGAQARHTRRN
jgi:hypothetical protein